MSTKKRARGRRPGGRVTPKGVRPAGAGAGHASTRRPTPLDPRKVNEVKNVDSVKEPRATPRPPAVRAPAVRSGHRGGG